MSCGYLLVIEDDSEFQNCPILKLIIQNNETINNFFFSWPNYASLML